MHWNFSSLRATEQAHKEAFKKFFWPTVGLSTSLQFETLLRACLLINLDF